MKTKEGKGFEASARTSRGFAGHEGEQECKEKEHAEDACRPENPVEADAVTHYVLKSSMRKRDCTKVVDHVCDDTQDAESKGGGHGD